MSDQPASLMIQRGRLSGLILNGRRYVPPLMVLLKPPVEGYVDEVAVMDYTAIALNGRVVTQDELIEWAKASGEAEVVVTRDPMGYGRCIKLEFIEAG